MRTLFNVLGLTSCVLLCACQQADNAPAGDTAQDMDISTPQHPAEEAPPAAGQTAGLSYTASTCEQAKDSVLRVTDMRAMSLALNEAGDGELSCLWHAADRNETLMLHLENRPGIASLPNVAPASAIPAPLFEKHGGNAITILQDDAKQSSRLAIFVAPDIQITISHGLPLGSTSALMSADLAYQVAQDLVQP